MKPSPLTSLVVTVCTTRFNIEKKSVSPTECMYVLVWLFEQTVISYLVGTETECLLRGTN